MTLSWYDPDSIPSEHYRRMFGVPAVEKELLSHLLYDNCDRWLLATEGTELLGFAGIKMKGDVLYCKHVYVYPQHRGRGVFSALADERLRVPHRVARAACLFSSLPYYVAHGFVMVRERANGWEVNE